MIGTERGCARDGVRIVHHDPDVKGSSTHAGNPVACLISETDFADLEGIRLIRGNSGRGRGIHPWKKPCVMAYLTGHVREYRFEGRPCPRGGNRPPGSEQRHARHARCTPPAARERRPVLRILKVRPAGPVYRHQKGPHPRRAGKRSGMSRSVLCVHRRFFGREHRRDSGKRLHAGGHCT